MEKSVRVSDEKKFKALFENTLAALFITKPDGTIVEANPAAEKMFGYTVEEFRKIGRLGVLDPDSPGLKEKIKEREKAGYTIGELIGIRKGGERFLCEFASSIFIDDNGERFTSTLMIDISAQKKFEQKLIEKEKQHATTLDAIRDYIFNITASDGEDYKVIYANEPFAKVLGMTKEQVIGSGLDEVLPEDSRLRDRSLIKQAIESKKSISWEETVTTPTGIKTGSITITPIFDQQGKFIQMINSIKDITEERKARKLIEESHERFEYVTQASSEAIWDYHPESDELFWGEGFQTLFGYDRAPGNLNYEHWREKIHPEDIAQVEKFIEKLFTNNSKKWRQEYRFKNADDSYSFVIDKGILIKNNQGKVVRMIGAIEDVTSRKIRDLQKSLAAKIHLAFYRAETINEALQASLENIMSLDHFLMSEIWMVNRHNDKLVLTNKSGLNERMKVFYEETASIQSFKYGEGLPGRTWKSERDLFWEDVNKRTSFLRKVAAKNAGLRKVLSFPIMDNGVVIGVFVLGLKNEVKNERYFTPMFRELSVTLGSEISRKKLEEELSMIFESAPDIICVAGLDGYFKKVNPAMSELLGYSEEEILSTPIIEFTHPEDRNKTRDELNNLRNEEGNLTFENRYITKAGKVVWLSWTTKPLFKQGITFSVAKNVTKQKEIEELLRQANQLSRTGSWEVDLIDNEVYWSEVTKEIHDVDSDYQPDVDTAINFYKEGENRDQLISAFKNAIENGVAYDMELQIVTKKGNNRWVRTIGVPEIVDGKCIRVYGSFQDIHENKELRRNLEKQAKELANSNAELEQFAFVASHDLQEPLRMITSFLAQLEKKYDDLLDERGKKYIYFATDGASRMRQMILDLLDYSRVGRINTDRTEVDINEIIENVMTLQQKTISDKKAEIKWDKMPVITAAKAPIQQLFQNLINNALHYQKPGQKPIIKIQSVESEQHWMFSVEDNGIGIHPDYTGKIFNLFQRLHSKEEYSGTGLGLAISKKIAEEHGGEIWVESEENQGSTFYFTIKK